jgi:uncharacterized repeat protein (TIGR03803 family)
MKINTLKTEVLAGGVFSSRTPYEPGLGHQRILPDQGPRLKVKQEGRWIAAGLRAAFCGAILAMLTTPGSAADRQVLRGHVPAAVEKLNLRPIGRLPATNRLNLAIGLPLRNTNALSNLLQDLYDPASPQFRHYLIPEQFTEQFGPTKQEYEAVRQFARKYGLEVTVTHSNRVLLDVAGQVADIEKAFQVTLYTYQHPTEARQFYAPDVEPSVEAGLAVLDISGLNNYALPRPASHRSSATTSAGPGSGSGPGGSYMGKDFRNAYAPGVALTGAGQLVGLLAFEAFYPGDITTYETMAGLANVPIQVVLLDGFTGIPVTTDPGGIDEASLDIEMAISMAPGLSKVVVFDAGPNGVANDVLAAMAANPQIKQFSSSWIGFWPKGTGDQLFQQMAAQGQSFFQGSGDGDSWINNGLLTPDFSVNSFWPADDPYITSVGGTSLTMNGSEASYASERVWNDGNTPPGWAGSGYLGSGGGISTVYPIPSWQKGLDMSANRGSTTRRNFPDVAMVAENFVIVANGSTLTGYWGTSFAGQLWAGFMALVNQEAIANGQPAVGFLNPALYALGTSVDYTNNLNDITVGNNATATSGGLFSAVPGYDLCTGWGSPKGSNLIHSLALPQRLVISPLSDLLFTGPVGGPLGPGALTYSLTNRTGSLDWSLALDAAWLTVSPTNGTLLAGGPATVVAMTPNLLATNLAAGSYAATLYCTNLFDQSVQTRHIALAIVSLPLITSQPTNQAVLEGMTATFSVGTATNALLYYQWQFDSGSGLMNLTDGGGISGSSTSSLTINNVSPGNVGAYSVTVSNASGPVTSDSASLTIITGQAPVIVSGPASQTLLPGATATFTVSAVGDQPLSYFWKLNGTNLANGGNLSGSATSTLTIRSATVANSGNYSVLVTNSFGSVTSAVAVLKLTGVTSSGVALETLYSFNTNSFGCLPFGGLIQAKNGGFYGTASEGGAQGVGTVFQMNPQGLMTLVYAFPNGTAGNYPPNGSLPCAALVQGTNGLLYGTAVAGGATGDGTVFRMTTSGTGTTAWSLNSASSGSVPYAGLVQGRDGNFYGTTPQGQAYHNAWPFAYGTLFRLTASGSLTAIHSFDYEDGAYPSSTLVQGADGSFYGTTQGGGTNGGWGTIFKATPAGILTPLFSFANRNGAVPRAGLVQDSDGAFYGTTTAGGASGAGTVFKLAADGTFCSLYSFTGGNDGSNCYGGLLLASDGNLYGTTESGGVYGLGTVFRITTDGTLATLVNFDGYQGANPECTLIQGTDGRLYGTTQNGGANGWGAIFRLSLDSPLQITQQPQPQQGFAGDTMTFNVATFGSLPVSYQWLKNGTNLSDGGNLSGSNSRTLTLTNLSVADAALYSVVVSNVYGAVTSAGARLEVIFSPPYLISGPEAQTVLVGATATFSVEAAGDALAFQWQENGTNLMDGGNISGSATRTLTLASVTVTNGGTYSVIVSNALDVLSSPSAALTVLPANPPGTLVTVPHLFSGGTSSFNPHAGVIEGTDGNFYGTTVNGGAGLYGTAFGLYTGGVFGIKHSFINGGDGASPLAGLAQASDGNFYGATLHGLGASLGTLFRLTSANLFTTLHAFGGGDDGGNPLASLVPGSDGNLYGTASTGGSNGVGTVFSLGTNGLFTPLWSFNSTNGSCPAGSLVQGSDGKLYGTTSAGGTQDLGTVFSLSTNGGFNSLVSFDYTAGAYPSNGLVQAADGAFYGTASSGGTNGGWGTVFRLTADGTLTLLHSFNYEDGAYPVGGLVQATDGNLYGTTSRGGIGGEGTVFQITTNGRLTTLVWFNGPNGANPQGALIQARDGSFYGTAEFGRTGYNGASGSGDGFVFRLILPLFLSNPFTQASATATAPYSASLSTNAVTPAGDVLTFAKVSGPAWLSVATDGTLSGTPAVADIGANMFNVSLADTNGWSSTATMTITVVPLPSISLSTQGTNIVLNWSGGQPPYSVQMATGLAGAAWQTIAGPMTNTTLLVKPSNAAAFYRIQGQ